MSYRRGSTIAQIAKTGLFESQVDAVGFSTQRDTFVPVTTSGESGRPSAVNPFGTASPQSPR